MKRVASGVLPVIAVERKISKPLHRQIYDSYRAAIANGSLRPGQRIPSTRVLASEIGVSRFPVLNAYAQLLAEGYLESRVGAGTVVTSSLPEQLTTSAPAREKDAPAGCAVRELWSIVPGQKIVSRLLRQFGKPRRRWCGFRFHLFGLKCRLHRRF